jgi:hypothetical protein
MSNFFYTKQGSILVKTKALVTDKDCCCKSCIYALDLSTPWVFVSGDEKSAFWYKNDALIEIDPDTNAVSQAPPEKQVIVSISAYEVSDGAVLVHGLQGNQPLVIRGESYSFPWVKYRLIVGPALTYELPFNGLQPFTLLSYDIDSQPNHKDMTDVWGVQLPPDLGSSNPIKLGPANVVFRGENLERRLVPIPPNVNNYDIAQVQLNKRDTNIGYDPSSPIVQPNQEPYSAYTFYDTFVAGEFIFGFFGDPDPPKEETRGVAMMGYVCLDKLTYRYE